MTGRAMLGDTALLLVAADAVVVAVILGAVAACLGVRAWRRRHKHGSRRGRPAGRRMWTVAELRARENADQLSYYPPSRSRTLPPAPASHGRASRPEQPRASQPQPPGRPPRTRPPRTQHGR